MRIRGVSADSRTVKPQDLFVAVHGFKADGNQYIPKALKAGCSAVVTEKKPGYELPVPCIVVPDSRKALSALSDSWFGQPSKNLELIGITGTNGKTTVSCLIDKILSKTGFRTGLLGTVHYRVGRKIYPAHHTTPEAPEIQSYLSRMVKKKTDYAVMEVSSHGLALHRVDHCRFRTAVFTNLTEDHFDFHKGFDDYFKAKSILFTLLKKQNKKNAFAVINHDDPWGRKLLPGLKNMRVYTYGLNEKADFCARNLEMDLSGSQFRVNSKLIHTRLPGRFNVYNTLAAIAVVRGLGISWDPVLKALKECRNVPGRFEFFSSPGRFSCIVDYAHTSDALEKVLATARELCQGRLITVFGCGGDRDRKKRPLMGRVADQNSDHVIVTNDNPRSENPELIISEILQGIKRKKNLSVISSRKKAIKKAFGLAGPDDLVVLAGKGHEDYQIFKTRTVHFSDREEVTRLMRDAS